MTKLILSHSVKKVDIMKKILLLTLLSVGTFYFTSAMAKEHSSGFSIHFGDEGISIKDNSDKNKDYDRYERRHHRYDNDRDYDRWERRREQRREERREERRRRHEEYRRWKEEQYNKRHSNQYSDQEQQKGSHKKHRNQIRGE